MAFLIKIIFFFGKHEILFLKNVQYYIILYHNIIYHISQYYIYYQNNKNWININITFLTYLLIYVFIYNFVFFTNLQLIFILISTIL